MAGKELYIKDCSPLKQRIGLSDKYHANCHYSYNLPLPNKNTCHIFKKVKSVLIHDENHCKSCY